MESRVPKDIIQYHGAFSHYIAPPDGQLLPQDQTRTSASLRQLAGFSDTHFGELSADMYEELQRRLKSKEGPLPPRSDIHWQRNDARKHVGLLPESRFREICRDLVTEQERRYPDLKTGPTYPLADSMPLSTIIRKKKSQKSVLSGEETASTISSQSWKRSDLKVKTDDDVALQIQSVSESSITPTKAMIWESDSDSDNEVPNSAPAPEAPRDALNIGPKSAPAATKPDKEMTSHVKETNGVKDSNVTETNGVKDSNVTKTKNVEAFEAVPPKSIRRSNTNKAPRAPPVTPTTRAPLTPVAAPLEIPRKSANNDKISSNKDIQVNNVETGSDNVSQVKDSLKNITSREDEEPQKRFDGDDVPKNIKRVSNNMRDAGIEHNEATVFPTSTGVADDEISSNKTSDLRTSASGKASTDDECSHTIYPSPMFPSTGTNSGDTDEKVSDNKSTVENDHDVSTDTRAFNAHDKKLKSATPERFSDKKVLDSISDSNELEVPLSEATFKEELKKNSANGVVSNENNDPGSVSLNSVPSSVTSKGTIPNVQKKANDLPLDSNEISINHDSKSQNPAIKQNTVSSENGSEHSTDSKKSFTKITEQVPVTNYENHSGVSSLVSSSSGNTRSITDTRDTEQQATNNRPDSINSSSATSNISVSDGSNGTTNNLAHTSSTLNSNRIKIQPSSVSDSSSDSLAAQYLAEMRALTKQHDEQAERARIADSEAAKWRHKYAKVVTKLEKLEFQRKQQQGSVSVSPPSQHVAPGYLSPNGKLSWTDLNEFFTSVNHLIAAVHAHNASKSSERLLSLLHIVIVSTRKFQFDDDGVLKRTANQLITTVRNFSVTHTLFPRILVDAACSDLSTAILEHVKNVKIKHDNTVPENMSFNSESDVSDVSFNDINDTSMNSFRQRAPESKVKVVNSLQDLQAVADREAKEDSKMQMSSTSQPEEIVQSQTQKVIHASKKLESPIKEKSTSHIETFNSTSGSTASEMALQAAQSQATETPNVDTANSIKVVDLHVSPLKIVQTKATGRVEPDERGLQVKVDDQVTDQNDHNIFKPKNSLGVGNQDVNLPSKNSQGFIQPTSNPDHLSEDTTQESVSMGNNEKSLKNITSDFNTEGSEVDKKNEPAHVNSKFNNDAISSKDSPSDVASKATEDGSRGINTSSADSPSSVNNSTTLVTPQNVVSNDQVHKSLSLGQKGETEFKKQNEPKLDSPIKDKSTSAITTSNSRQKSITSPRSDRGRAMHVVPISPPVSNGSMKSPTSAPAPRTPPAIAPRSASRSDRYRYKPAPHDHEVVQLQKYIEEKMSGTVDAISELLSGIKNNAPSRELKSVISTIQVLVGGIIKHFNETLQRTHNQMLKEKGTFLVDNLDHCLTRMEMLRLEELDAIAEDAKPNRHLKQRLAGVSYDMAKCTKELVKTVEYVSLNMEVNDIDRMLD